MLQITGLNKIFSPGTVNERLALEDINLHLLPGDYVTLIGGNGAGKSTLLNVISGVHRQDSGSIYLDGKRIDHLPEHRRAADLGRVFQDPLMGTAADMEIQENLALAALRGKPRGLAWGVSAQDKALFHQRLAELDLDLQDRMATKVRMLSGGQRQALTLLMAILKTPKLLLLDEHTAALDPKTAAKVLELSDRIVEENGLTTMMVTHNMKDAIVHGNRLIMMYDGRIVIDVSGEEKKKLTVPDLLALFSKVSGSDEADDKLLLS